ncbi:carboxypeptidase B-like [Eriocheir sinensis]|uniref:carboxypeptidase B-like n=1 Tax=Eriocheir sinensis TaxID=95602 RepID=UPI0021CA508D|nr:carboxypeptidase B-like [Eriocheir sinensis]
MKCTTAAVAVTVVAMVVVEGTPLVGVQPVSYSGWKVLEVQLGAAVEGVTAADSPGLDLTEIDDGASVQVLTQNRRAGTAELAVSPSALLRVTQHLETRGAPYTTIVDDLGSQLQETRQNLRSEPLLDGDLTLSRFMTYDEIKTHVEALQGRHPRQVKVEVAGRSVEGRPIHLVTLTDDVANAHAARKPVVFVEGGIHAREWVSPSAVLGVVNNLLQTPNLTAGLEWRIMPLVNPDGYLASWRKNRLWRKNTARTSGTKCVGVDLNRNFGYHWGDIGSSSNPCSQLYRGPHAFSEPEAAAVRDAMLEHKARIKAYVTFHSYGQLILYPWSYTYDKHDNNDRMAALSNGMAEAINRTNGEEYTVGHLAQVLNPVGGTSGDWAVAEAHVPLVFVLELRDRGLTRFSLPEKLIQPTVNDAWQAIKYLAEELLRENTPSSTGETPTPQPTPQESPETTTEAPAEVTEGEVKVESQTPADVNKVSEGSQKPGNQEILETTTRESKPEIQGVPETTTEAPTEVTEGQVKGDSQAPVKINQVSEGNQKPETQKEPETTTKVPMEVAEQVTEGQVKGDSQTPVKINQVSEGNQKPETQKEPETTTKVSMEVAEQVTEGQVKGDNQTPVNGNQALSEGDQKPENQRELETTTEVPMEVTKGQVTGQVKVDNQTPVNGNQVLSE